MPLLREGETMNQPGDQASANYVTCRCLHCGKGIEFDANQMGGDETRTVECPHCQLETTLVVTDKKEAPAANPDTLDLNPSQLAAATFNGGHALVLAGAGCGKTKTIIARCEHLIANGLPASIRSFFTPAMTGIGSEPTELLREPVRLVAEDVATLIWPPVAREPG